MASKAKNNDFTLIAHRGASYDAPENTFESFDLALELGFANIETDIQLTSDGRVVVIHDSELDRTTDATGLVAETTIAKIKSLNAGLWFEGPDDGAGVKGPMAYPEAFVPTLDDILERYAGKIHLHLELKSKEPELSELAHKSLEKWGWLDQSTGGYESPGLTMTSFHFEQLERSIALMPNIAHGWLVQNLDKATLTAAFELGLSGIYPNASKVTKKQVTDAHKAGLSVRTWGIADSKPNLHRAYRSGATGTTVDWPAIAREVIEAI
ncbi:MAG: hypothetical protein CL731_02360 [Chloroflexi bacterium]|nr:hypothetical protein [Chloroflexota bacterium]